MHTGTNETTPFHIFKDEVAKSAALSVDRLHLGHLHTAFDAGEPVWMVAATMKMLDEINMPPVKPYKLPDVNKVAVRRVKI